MTVLSRHLQTQQTKKNRVILFNPFLGRNKSYKSAYAEMPLQIYRYMIQKQGYPTSILPLGVEFKNGCIYLTGKRGAKRQEKINELIKKHSLWGSGHLRSNTEVIQTNKKEELMRLKMMKKSFSRLKTNCNRQKYNREYRKRPRVQLRRRQRMKEWARNNKKLILQYTKKKRENIIYRIRENIKERERKALKAQNAKRTYSITDSCTDQELEKHIKDNWEPWMNFDNYGELADKEQKCWQIDHIKEVHKFDLKDPLQQKMCFELKNIQPLEKFENQRKGGWGFPIKN